MSQGQSDGAWESSHEVVVGDAERAVVAQLVERDQQLGQRAAAKYGSGGQHERSVLRRLAYRPFFELKKVLGPTVRKGMRFSRRQWSMRIADRARIADGSVFGSDSASFEVRSLDSPDIAAALSTSSAQFWVLTRGPHQLLRSAVKSITAAVSEPDVQVWFGDSRNSQGIREHRAAFNRLLLRQVDALGPVVIVRRSVLRELVQTTACEPLLWLLALGLTVDPSAVQLIPDVLGVGEATVSKLGSHELAACELVGSELKRSGLKASVQALPLGRRDVRYSFSGQPLVSIIIPTRGTVHDGTSCVVEAVRSIIDKSSYSHIEIVIVADDPTPQWVVDEVDGLAGSKVRWVRWSEQFNFSSKMNLGAACATGEHLLFLNDDVEVVSVDWIERMISLLDVDGIGHVGALLFFENQMIQHAGHLHRRGVGHVDIGQRLRLKDSGQLLVIDRLRAGVTAACSVMKRELFEAIGGFSPEFPGNYNDADLCLKVREAGHLNAVSGHARLYHFESITRDAKVHKFERERLFGRWWQLLQQDEYSRG